MHIIRYNDAKGAIESGRNLVKIVEPVLRKEVAQKGEWKPGTEIECSRIEYSLCKHGTRENLHYHKDTWEMYQVLEGELAVAAKCSDTAEYEKVVLQQNDILMLPPQTPHIAKPGADNITQVIQFPPDPEGKVVIEDAAEIKAAENVLE